MQTNARAVRSMKQQVNELSWLCPARILFCGTTLSTAMSKRISNGIGLRAAMESKGIGLNSSGSYVLSSFDAREFESVQRTDFAGLEFSNEDHVVVASGKKGSLAKLARVTQDRKFARYLFGNFISVALIEGQVYSRSEFIRSIAQNGTLHVVKVSTAKDYVGILHGDMAAAYKSLVYPTPNGFLILDLEEKPPPQSVDMMVRIVAVDPPEGAEIKAALLKRFA
jgi:hypothetical protein